MHRDPSAASKLIAAYAFLHRVSACCRVFSAAIALPGSPYRSSTALLSNTLLRAYARNALPHAALSAFAAIPAHKRDSFIYCFLIRRSRPRGWRPCALCTATSSITVPWTTPSPETR
jgi:hypothetical protein